MPLLENAKVSIRDNLTAIARGGKPRVVEIGYLTLDQLAEINRSRAEVNRLNPPLNLIPLENNVIIFLGRHIYNSRSRDGYTAEDMIVQIGSAMSTESIVTLDKFVSGIYKPIARADGYGNMVYDKGILEITSRRPRAELFSVMPKGDAIKPPNAQKPA